MSEDIGVTVYITESLEQYHQSLGIVWHNAKRLETGTSTPETDTTADSSSQQVLGIPSEEQASHISIPKRNKSSVERSSSIDLDGEAGLTVAESSD